MRALRHVRGPSAPEPVDEGLDMLALHVLRLRRLLGVLHALGLRLLKHVVVALWQEII